MIVIGTMYLNIKKQFKLIPIYGIIGNVYDTSNRNRRKHFNEKKGWVILKGRFIIKGIVPLMMVFGLIACSNQGDEKKNVNTSTKSSTEVQNDEHEKKENNHSVTDATEAAEDNTKIENKATKTDINMDNMKKVGKEEYGYVNVPKDWVNFKDVNPNTSFQVSSMDGSQIISLNVFKDAGKDATLETYANIVAANMKNDGGKDIKGASVTLGKYQALQVYGSYKQGNYFLVAWVFKAEDGKYHYVCAEGVKDKILDVVSFIEKGGWSLK